jgi:sporulation protein YlmC with PRC-barrel domain
MTDTAGMTDTMGGVMTDTLVVGTRLILDIPEETFQEAPGIDENLDLTDPATVGDMETFYRDLGEDVIGRPIAETNLDELTGRVIKLSDLDGANVQNPAGDGVGEIDDILIDLQAGRVEYFILSFGGFLGIGDSLYAVPMDAFEVIPTSAEVEAGSPALVLDVSEEQLEQAPVFDDVDLGLPDWDMETRNFWLETQ